MKQLARLYAGGTPDREKPHYWENGSIPWLNSGEVNQWLVTQPSTYITEDGLRNSSAKWIPKEALVIALAGQGKTKGMVAQLAIASTCNQSMAAIVPSAAIAPRFLLWWLHANYETIRNLAGDELRDGLNLDIIGDVPCPRPSLIAQRAIVDFLDRETAQIDALTSAKRRLLELAEAAFRSRQGGRLIGLDHPDRKQALLLGDMPTHWEARRAKFCTGGVTVGVVVNPSSYFVDSGIPFIHGSDVREGYVDMTDLKYLSPESNSVLAKSQVHQGDVVAMRVGYPGRAAVVPPELDGANCASVLIFRRSDVLVPEMVAEFLNSTLGRAQIEAVQYGAAQEVMNVSDAVNLVLPVPPKQEQVNIAQELAHARQSFESTQSLINVQLRLLHERRVALVTAAVIGALEIPGVAA